MRKNIIILTHGWTGSSVSAALLGRAGYWLGSSTVQKRDYDTFENADLVARNQELLHLLAPDIDHQHHFAFEDVSRIAHASANLDLYLVFISYCLDKLWLGRPMTWTIASGPLTRPRAHGPIIGAGHGFPQQRRHIQIFDLPRNTTTASRARISAFSRILACRASR